MERKSNVKEESSINNPLYSDFLKANEVIKEENDEFEFEFEDQRNLVNNLASLVNNDIIAPGSDTLNLISSLLRPMLSPEESEEENDSEESEEI